MKSCNGLAPCKQRSWGYLGAYCNFRLRSYATRRLVTTVDYKVIDCGPHRIQDLINGPPPWSKGLMTLFNQKGLSLFNFFWVTLKNVIWEKIWDNSLSSDKQGHLSWKSRATPHDSRWRHVVTDPMMAAAQEDPVLVSDSSDVLSDTENGESLKIKL